ncbi:MerR family transcriptional regulator [Actinoplanes sp. CA-142083]|uniref:MerR family transcriptional regulator n=1 Tax=Actinoplanes sp. CA-142083 TaxID=3239903 RepID=UPI003D8C34BA
MTTQHLETLAIGEFGRLAGLSVKALRFYDVHGLLPPGSVDPASGYRRYRADQLDRARRISLLRGLDMPLAIVAEILELSDEEAVLRLDRWWASQEAIMQSRRGSLTWLRAQLVPGAAPPELTYGVSVREVPTVKVAALRAEASQTTLVQVMRECEWMVRSLLHDQMAFTTGEHWVIYHGLMAPDSDTPIEVCVPFSGAVEPEGEMAIRLEPAHREVYATVARDDTFYPRIARAYEAVSGHVAANGLVPSGPEREIYLNQWDRVAGTDPFVHVAQPIEE